MSGSDDPFGRSDKTVLRLNPGGRRAVPPAPTPAPPAPAYPPARPPGNADQGDTWFNTPTPAPPPPSSGRGAALLLKRDVPVALNANILLEAAGPLLLLLGRLRTSLMSANFANLMEQVADAIEEFGKTMRAESLPPETTEDALYIVCATCDDIVQNIPTEERAVWTQYSMLTRFFGERVGGVRFYEKLEQARQDPTTNYDLLELFYACLSMGFQGIHRTSAGGAATLQMLQRNLYEALRKVRGRTRGDLSPHWRGQNMPTAGSTFRIPLWVLGMVAAAGLFALWVTLRVLLSGNTEAITTEMARIFPDTPLQIERPQVATPTPPVPVRASTQLERIRAQLKPEIEQNKVDPVESGQSIIIRVGSFALFESGQASVKPEFAPIAAKIAQALDREPGPIRIVGHTDNTRITTARFPSNYELSLERARAVAALIKPLLKDPTRPSTEGKGESAPIAPNQTNEGRARNRRVEISIPREETLTNQNR